MAWTAPRTWNTGEVVTAAIMNTHVRDNLNYLRGLAGAVNINNSLGVGSADFTPANLLHVHSTTVAGAKIKLSSAAPGFELQDNVADASRTMAGGLGFGTAAGHFGGGAGDMNFYTAANAGSQTNGIRFSTARDTSGNYAERLFIPGGYATGAGRIGINTSTPQGPLHIAGAANGGAIFFDSASVAGSAVAVLPAAGMTAVGIGFAVARSTDNALSGAMNGPFLSVPGAGNNDYNIVTDGGTNICVLRVASTGAVSLIRTAGSKTYRVILWMLYY